MHPSVLPALSRLSTPSLAPIVNRAILSVSGSQSSEFLNGLLSTSVRDPPRNQFSSFLNAQGRVMYDVFLYGTANGYLLEYDSRTSEAPSLLSYLKRHVLRSKVKFRDVTDEFDVWAAWGSSQDIVWQTKRQWSKARSGVVEPFWPESDPWPWGSQEHVIHDRRADGMGRRLLVKKSELPQDKASYDLKPHADYVLHRISNGVPEGVTDILPMHAFPMDSNLDLMGGLDFRKGCYVGQELTVRTYHTGVVRKRILPIRILDPSNPESTIPSLPDHIDIKAVKSNVEGQGIKPRGSGKLLTNQDSYGLALLRLEHLASFFAGDVKLELEDPRGKKLLVEPWVPLSWPDEAHSPIKE